MCLVWSRLSGGELYAEPQDSGAHRTHELLATVGSEHQGQDAMPYKSLLAAGIPVTMEGRTNAGQPWWLLSEEGRQAGRQLLLQIPLPGNNTLYFWKEGKTKEEKALPTNTHLLFYLCKAPTPSSPQSQLLLAARNHIYKPPPWLDSPQRAAQVSLQHFL